MTEDHPDYLRVSKDPRNAHALHIALIAALITAPES